MPATNDYERKLIDNLRWVTAELHEARQNLREARRSEEHTSELQSPT